MKVDILVEFLSHQAHNSAVFLPVGSPNGTSKAGMHEESWKHGTENWHGLEKWPELEDNTWNRHPALSYYTAEVSLIVLGRCLKHRLSHSDISKCPHLVGNRLAVRAKSRKSLSACERSTKCFNEFPAIVSESPRSHSLLPSLSAGLSRLEF
jgi:hypothetical protein